MTTSTNSPNVVRHRAAVIRSRRETLNGHMSVNLWFTGLSGSGKSTLAHAVEERLHLMGCRTYVFDGDNVATGFAVIWASVWRSAARTCAVLRTWSISFWTPGLFPSPPLFHPFMLTGNGLKRFLARKI